MAYTPLMRKWPSIVVGLGGVCVVALIVAVALAAESGDGEPASRGPLRPVALGVSSSDPVSEEPALDEFSATVGRKPALVMWYQSWAEPLFYPEQLELLESRGAIPMVTWLPQAPGRKISLQSIERGAHDDYLRTAARDATEWGKPLLVRFAHEMNGYWYPWGNGVRANGPGDYIAAWRHVVRVFRRAGATNVRWVWSPNVFGDMGRVARFEPFYPGDEWVDWTALDGYNWGDLRPSGRRSFTELFGESYDAMETMSEKPMMIAETASTEFGSSKAAWITDGLERALPSRFPRVRALVWFDRDKETDWRVSSSPEAAAAMRGVVASPVFSLSATGLLGLGGRSRRASRAPAG